MMGVLATVALATGAERARAQGRDPIHPPYKPPILAQTLYQQEGTAKDGYLEINAAGKGPTGNIITDSRTNWKYQYGAGTWSGVYSWGGSSPGWLEPQTTGDRRMLLEADIELCSQVNLRTSTVPGPTGRLSVPRQSAALAPSARGASASEETQAGTTVSGLKIYFHIGNVYQARQNPDAALTAYVTGTLSSNHGQYVGLCFTGANKTAANFEKDGAGRPTGRVFNAMVGSVDIGGRSIAAEKFDASFLLDSGAGYVAPDYFGDSPDHKTHDTLWWLIGGGAPGSYGLSWKVRVLPSEHQADGNYHLAPTIVVAPTM